MGKTRIVGDVHGLQYDFRGVLDNLPSDVSQVIQVGDLSVGFGQGDYWHESLEEIMIEKNARFIRGNHDNPNTCRSMKTWISDATVESNVFYMGGAWSIDHASRTPGRTWWADEELSYADFLIAADVYGAAKPDVVITHDCPLGVSTEMFFESGLIRGKQYNTRTALALDSFFEIHQPKLWVFGHWHYSVHKRINGCDFVCLNELDYIDVDFNDFDQIQDEIGEKFYGAIR